MCLSCESGYENLGLVATVQGRACQKCPPKITIFLHWMLLLCFWTLCVRLLSVLFAQEALHLISMRGPVIRLLLVYFQAIGFASEQTHDHIDLPGDSLLQCLFVRPLDLVYVSCLMDEVKPGSAMKDYLDLILKNAALAFAIFLLGCVVIISFHIYQLSREAFGPMVKAWGLKGPLYFLCLGFPTHQRSSRKCGLKLAKSGSVCYSITDAGQGLGDDGDEQHFLEGGPGSRFVVGNLVNHAKSHHCDGVRHLIAWTMVMYPVVLRSILHLNSCTREAFGGREAPRLAKSLEVICEEGENAVYNDYNMLATTLSTIWFGLVPLMFFLLVWNKGAVNSLTVQKRATLGMLYQGYMPRRSCWHPWVMLRSALLIFASKPTYQIGRMSSSVGMLVFSLALHVRAQPYVSRERFGLWHLDTQMHFAVALRYLKALADEFPGQLTNMEVSWGVDIKAVLFALSVVMHATCLLYAAWLLLMLTVDPHVDIMGRRWKIQSLGWSRWMYRAFVSCMRGVSRVIVGWERGGEKFIDMRKLYSWERRFLLQNLQDTLQVCVESHRYFAPHMLEVAFHDAFRRAISSREGRRVFHETQKTRRDKCREAVRRFFLEPFMGGIDMLTGSSRRPASGTADSWTDFLVRAEQSGDVIARSFALSWSPHRLDDFDERLAQLTTELGRLGISKAKVECGLLVTDIAGREVDRQVCFVDRSRFPLRVAFDVGKQVNTEELAAALADVNIDISTNHPEIHRLVLHLHGCEQPKGADLQPRASRTRVRLPSGESHHARGSARLPSDEIGRTQRTHPAESFEQYQNLWWRRQKSTLCKSYNHSLSTIHTNRTQKVWEKQAEEIMAATSACQHVRSEYLVLEELRRELRKQLMYNRQAAARIDLLRVTAHADVSMQSSCDASPSTRSSSAVNSSSDEPITTQSPQSLCLGPHRDNDSSSVIASRPRAAVVGKPCFFPERERCVRRGFQPRKRVSFGKDGENECPALSPICSDDELSEWSVPNEEDSWN
jgi:hypothetical protein